MSVEGATSRPSPIRSGGVRCTSDDTGRISNHAQPPPPRTWITSRTLVHRSARIGSRCVDAEQSSYPEPILVTKWPCALSMVRHLQFGRSSVYMAQRRFLLAPSLARLIRKDGGVAGR